MKTKKRALLSAIAMLVVSAVVLSSATFAWFVAGDNANINTIAANVATSSSIQISADKVSWTATLNAADMTQAQVDFPALGLDNSFPALLSAVSFNALGDRAIYDGALENNKAFTATGVADQATKLVKFTFWIRSGEDASIVYTTSTLTGAANNAVYSAVQIGDAGADNAASKTPVVFVGTTNSYTPIGAATNGTDTDNNGIMNGAEFPTYGTPVTGTLFAAATPMGMTAMAERQVIVYMWLEGQDANTKLGTNGTSGQAQLALNFIKG